MQEPATTAPYDAVLLVSFGGPEGPQDVLPFLENVTRGRGIPRERLLEVAEHYFAVDGVSPINGQNRALVAALEQDFRRNGVDLPVYWGNRNWHPFLASTLEQMVNDGVRRVLAILTSAYSSYSGCRQYREDLALAVQPLGAKAPRIDRVRHYFNHPGFIEPMVENTVSALNDLPAAQREHAQLVFVTHSIPEVMNTGSGPEGGAYIAQHQEVAQLVSAGVAAIAGPHDHTLVYCSRSGPPSVAWLEPDVNEHLESLANPGRSAAVLIPIGFVSDHMEVVHDLDMEALATAGRVGLICTRARTVGTDERFVAGLRQLVLERAAVERGDQVPRSILGQLGPSHDVCPTGCCANPRANRPALCGA